MNLFTPEILQKIDDIAASAGHNPMKKKRGSAKGAQEKQRKIEQGHREYTDEARRYVEKVRATISSVSGIMSVKSLALVCEIEN